MPGSNALLVEGTDDEHVLRHIAMARSISELFEVQDLFGIENLLQHIPTRLTTVIGNDDVVGIVVDADASADSRWQSIRDILSDVGYGDIPATPNLHGTIVEPPAESPLPKVGVWIMPDNVSPGTLEDLLLAMIPQDDVLLIHAQSCLDSLVAPPFRDVDRPKALMHTWLAWQKQPGRPYGTSIGAGFLDASVPQVDGLVDWLERLFTS